MMHRLACYSRLNIVWRYCFGSFRYYSICCIIAFLIFTTAEQGISPIKKGKFFVHKTWNTIGHVAQNQGKTTNRAQPLIPIFRINILQQGFTVKGSSAYTMKKWFLWLVVRLIVCGLRIMMNHLTSCWLVVACVHCRTIP